jgi:hypothetical protein
MNIPPPRRFLELIRQYSMTYKNWYNVMYSIFAGKAKIDCDLNNGQHIILEPKEAILLAGFDIVYLEADTVIFNHKGRKVTLKGWKYGYPGDSFSDYIRLNVKGKRVLDIGASIGDSPIYFSLAGAKEIIAVEIDKKRVELMRENLKVNNIDNVTIIDKGVSEKDNDDEISYLTLIRKYGPFDAAKIDCDGCERMFVKYIKEIPELLIEWDNMYKDLTLYLRKTGIRLKMNIRYTTH